MNGTKKGLNWFDGVVCVLLAVAVAGVCWLLLWRGGEQPSGREQVTLRYVVRVGSLREELADAVVIGDGARDGSSGRRNMGTVVAYQTEETIYYSKNVTLPNTDENGNIYFTPVASVLPGKVDLYVTLEAAAELGEDGRYYVDGEALSVGTNVELMTRHFWGVGFYVSVTEAE